MAYVEVDVDLNDFETWELVDELVDRITNKRHRRSLTKADKDELLASLGVQLPAPQTMLDQLKMELLKDAADRYTLEQLETILKKSDEKQAENPNQLKIPMD